MAQQYNKQLQDVEWLQLPVECDWAKHVYWMYGVVVKPETGLSRDDLMKYLKEKGVDTRTFFCSMADQPFLMKQKGYRKIDTPVADMLWNCGLYLPSSQTLSEKHIQQVTDAIKSFSK